MQFTSTAREGASPDPNPILVAFRIDCADPSEKTVVGPPPDESEGGAK